MEPFENEIIIKINEEWFSPQFEKIIKRYIKDQCKREMMHSELMKLLREANDI